jgi:hypothetical protein
MSLCEPAISAHGDAARTAAPAFYAEELSYMEHRPDLELVELHCAVCGSDAFEAADGTWLHGWDKVPLDACGFTEPVEHGRTDLGGAA